MAETPVIKLEKITKVYQMGDTKFEALRGVDATIGRHELLAIIGPSGSGKSTTMHIIGLLDRPSGGEYYLNGKTTASLSAREKAVLRNQSIGFVFQSFFLLPKLNALENVELPLMYRRQKTPNMKSKAMECLAKVGMEKFAHHLPGELSGGQQQRVAIARALVGDPDIILADEPTGALDSKTSNQVMELLTETSKQATIIIVTHDPDVARQCRRVLHLKDGVISTEGNIEDA